MCGYCLSIRLYPVIHTVFLIKPGYVYIVWDLKELHDVTAFVIPQIWGWWVRELFYLGEEDWKYGLNKWLGGMVRINQLFFLSTLIS